MSDLPFRFLHAADFQLDRPMQGLSEVPEHMRELLIDAPYQAAERVFDVAVAMKVPLVCLAGNLIGLDCPSARALDFLQQQFERLAEHGVTVFWAGGQGDSGDSWRTAVTLPSTVHCCGRAIVETLRFEDKSGFQAVLLGRGGADQSNVEATDFRVQEYDVDRAGPFSIAVATGQADGRNLSTQPISFWALGGRLDRKNLFTEPHVAHYPGTPQGRDPSDIGPHGCTIVEVGAAREVRMRLVPCDVVRWQHERLLIASGASWDELSRKLAERVDELRSQSTGVPLLTRWTIVASDLSADRAALQGMATRAAKWLIKQYGRDTELCWPVSVDVETAELTKQGSCDEDSLLGDYLEAMQQMQDAPETEVVRTLSDSRLLQADLQWVGDISNQEVRSEVFRKAAELGAALLRGEELV